MIYVIKVFVSALVIVAVNALSKRSTTLAAMLLALPLVSVIAFTWEWTENSDAAKLAHMSIETFWFVLPTLPMFLLLGWLLQHGYHYFFALAICSVITALLFATTQYLLQRFV